ncbi:M3 family metallopeptidase [Chromobacterium sp. IIBBL 290-4]|uniref:M3 family metallopeptidase n=1 Tax=Chromobacterium sp. IIBBL 290-4 TaxID=2953890 RepID=UPI0020B7C358|nr:M3 family metallopeptidase [Chromobacterium sp. IIBBL 290-4]UTH72728.1 M3 family metallopeptidase [Chromobacterium sp. IIBBL 290-4]
MSANPLLQAWNTPHQLPPFDQVQAEHFEPAFDVLFAEHLAEIDQLAALNEPASFENTAAAFDRSGLRLERAQLLLDNLTASQSSPALQEVERNMAPKLAGHHSRIHMHEGFFARLDQVHARRAELGLSEEQDRLLDLIHRNFVRAGAKLQGADRQRYADVVGKLAELTTAFSQNVLADEAEYTLVLEEQDLAGLPAFLIDAAQAAAQARGLAGWVITLSRSAVVPFLTFSPRRDLREQAWRAWTGRGEHPERDNRPLAKQILALRVEQARLLGFANFADYAIANRMAGTPAAVHALLEQVWEPAKGRFEAEKVLLREEAAKLGEPTDIQPWDWFHLAEKVRIARYALDDAEIKPYFSLDNMIAAMFDVAGRLFGLSFSERHDLKLYHPDARAWDVSRAGQIIGLFLGDNFARPHKRGGAWMHSYRYQSRNGGETQPIVVNNNNFAKASHGQTLLSADDVRTLFHEFGHGLHGLLSNVEYRLLAGPNCPWDYVELPSQLMENWALAPEILEKHARHAETGEPIPAELVAKIKAARHFNQGFDTVRYTASTLIDLALHQRADADGVDISAFEAAERERLGIPPEAGMNHRPPHFGHIFSDDAYAAGYYVYMWAEVLEAEAFAAFEEAGDPFNPELADKLYRHIYSAGDAREQRAAFRAFRGHDPRAEEMLKNRGLI